MDTLSLDEVPPQLETTAQDVWLHQESSDPEPGDLWLLSWNGDALALALVASVYPGFVRAWPVTLDFPDTNGVALEVKSGFFKSPLSLWPHHETGLGTHLLHRKIDSLLSEKQINLLRRFAYENSQPPLPYVQAGERGASRVTRDDIMRLFRMLCFIEWPQSEVGEAILVRENLSAHGKTAADVAEVLKLEVAEALAIWTGKKSLDEAAIRHLCSVFELQFEDCFKSPDGPEVRELQRPAYKDGMIRLAALRGLTESQSRNATREEFALAARATGPSKSLSTRVRAALERLLEEHDAPS